MLGHSLLAGNRTARSFDMSDEDYDSEASGSSYEEVSKAAYTDRPL